MKSWHEHLKFGLFFEVPFILIILFADFIDVTFISIFQILILIILSPLLPDIDHRQGKLRDNLTAFFLFSALINSLLLKFFNTLNLVLFSVYFACSVFFVSYVTKHRGLIHSIITCLCYSVITYVLTKEVSLSVLAFVGFYSHLIADKIPFKLF